jgi:hypothetical protein
MVTNAKNRIKLAERAGWSCGWCGQKTRADMGWQNSATIEHVTPRSEGGSNKVTNLMSACARCNRLRGTQNAEEFKMVAQEFDVDRRTQAEALHTERKQYRKQRQQQLADMCGADKFTYTVVPDSELTSLERKRKDRTLVRQALEKSRRNPFEPGSRRHVMFERELEKLPMPSIWSQLLDKLTAACRKLYSAITVGEKHRENCVR